MVKQVAFRTQDPGGLSADPADFLVNEDAFGPKINPMKALYWEQFGGGPAKEMLKRMSPSRLISGKKKTSKK